jgi:hypothetical protein
LIEASLLLNGYSFVPVDEKTMKVLGPSKFPRAEGIPIFSSPYMLPATDQVVSYFMKLNYLAPQEAAQLFQTFVSPPNAYTSFTPVPNVQAVLITDDEGFGHAVAAAVERALLTLPRRAIAGASWRDYGAVICVRDLAEAAALSDRIAPEHLELCVADPEALLARIRHAGAVFLGAWTPEAIGDYVGGPNHVLPTARSARFSSGLSVLDFLKRTTIARMTPGALAEIGEAAERLAAAEGLQAHGLSVRARLDRLNGGDA